MEIWKDIEGYEGYYQISNLGRVKSLIRKSTGTNTTKENFLNLEISKKGYYRASLSMNGKIKKISLHRLIAIHFIDNPFNKKCVNHINGVRLDNRIENLEWSTYSENSKHGYVSNKRKNPIRKLEEWQVLEIKSKLNNFKRGDGLRLANEYGVSKYIISLIKTGKTYKEENLF